MTRILFVCLGNICRSPTAEGIFTQHAKDAGLSHLTIDSAGTASWHSGKPPYEPMQDACRARGYDLSPLRARQFTAQDFYDFDLVLVMDQSNMDDVESLRPNNLNTPVQLFLEYANNTELTDVPDPYYTRDFDQTIDLVEMASVGLIASLG
ncbi:low molecular weight protein-tyrosine-phosphatase [Hirschia baltica]|uniref:protein-tyrosine-phosphatase n=1 Tax=Hirschia baltica (strain ATCC 49814 / DSM 5838 / IFAM 1418) TaxID=582402 RepID=C6XKD9_HIRBI|nr:low molecular weight protein-tyrosine-phosphatase [Hirschia baltica]ACT57737.1 protein tyrosine phosphatase [Hirschia baltica ATCC 49814]